MVEPDDPTFAEAPNVPVSQSSHPLMRPLNPRQEKCPHRRVVSITQAPISCPYIHLHPGCRMINIPTPQPFHGIPQEMWSHSLDPDLIRIWYHSISTFSQILVILPEITLQLGQNIPLGCCDDLPYTIERGRVCW